MTGEILSFLGSELQESLESNVWQAATTVALTIGAIWGALLYVTDQRDTHYVPVCADRASLRGLVKEVRDDLRVMTR
jgi:hypothetical protein